jgi:hypothetical protein
MRAFVELTRRFHGKGAGEGQFNEMEVQMASLEGCIKSAKATGVTEEEILEIAKLATFIKGKGASHVDRRITALERGIAPKSRTQNAKAPVASWFES